MRCEVAVIGGGFGGTLVAMCLAAQGRDVIVLERERHPRFAIGESSTPLANLVLEDIIRTYSLEALLPLCRYGTWKQSYPKVRCGPKRGFSFFAHEPGRPFEAFSDHRTELLVAANPSQDLADTQWLRSDVDALFSETAKAQGVRVLEGVSVLDAERGRRWKLALLQEAEDASSTPASGRSQSFSADFVIDASGGASPLHTAVGLTDTGESLATRSRAIFSHFEGVDTWHTVCSAAGGNLDDHPFPADDAALHHMTREGWIWMLRFDHGVTSVGAVLTDDGKSGSIEEEWKALFERYPSVAAQMSAALPTRPLVRTSRLQRRLRPAAGPDWALLPGAAYFIDPLLSPGNAHTMHGVERLSRIFESWPDRGAMAVGLDEYDSRLQAEVDFLDPLIHGCYLAIDSLPLLAAYTMYYFAGAIHSEERRRDGTAEGADGFLHSHDEAFRGRVMEAYHDLADITEGPVDAGVVEAFASRVAADIEPWNTTGLCDPERQNMYPYK